MTDLAIDYPVHEAAAVDIINRGKGGKKLPNWWAAS